MNWAAIIMMLLSYFLSKKSGASDTKALLTAGLVGAGTYYVANETEWGQENLNWFEGDNDVQTGTQTPVKDANGNIVRDANGNILNKLIDSTGKVLTSWGGTGTAAVIGTTTIASSDSLRKYLPWIAGGLGLFLLTR